MIKGRGITMTISTLTSKGQATIPKPIRDFLGLAPRERIAFSIEDGQVIIKRASFTTAEVAGCLKQTKAKPFPDESKISEAVARSAIARDQRTRK